MSLNVFAALITLIMAILLFVYLRAHRVQREGEFSPAAAWLRAGIFFCFFYLLSWATGTMEAIASEPVFTAEQASNPVWQVWVAGLTLFILFAYWGIWARYTIRFERKREFVPQLVFGLLWGTGFGQMFLSVWHIAETIGPDWASWQVYLASYLFISLWQWLLMDMYWDIYISPEHDSPLSIALKVPTTHIPNVTLCLIFFALYENHVIFIALQCLALVGCSLAMRMPSPWCKQPTLPARQAPSMFFGMPRCAGYQADDPASDPWLKQAHLPR
jgi:hypothetical protein